MAFVFEIENLYCAYHPNAPVLRISRLDIPQGKLIFVLGRSGVGKSTFIETLGLMNRTVVQRPDTVLRFLDQSGIMVDIQGHWKLNDRQLSDFRRHHFSFVFQNTNLMPNFTSGENMMVSLLLQGHDHDFAKKEVLRMMERLDLPSNLFNSPISNVSGGQRQRLAFVRAVTSQSTVLFGDEPTGNLDPNTATSLLESLRDILRERRATGIIVSHDLPRAIRFADFIIPLRRVTLEDGREIGEADNSYTLVRNGDNWSTVTGEILPDPNHWLEQQLTTTYKTGT